MSLPKFRRLTCATIVMIATVCFTLSAAELRTSSGGRAVSRTVQANYSAPVAEETVEGELATSEFADSCSNCSPCSSCSGGHACGTQICQSCCFHSNGAWADFDFLLAWRHGHRTPPLVTTGSALDPNPAALGQPGTVILFPTEAVGEDARPGARISVGTWLDPYQCWGIEGRYFMLADEESSNTFASAGGVGDPILARPVFNLDLNNNGILNEAGDQGQDVRLLAFPGFVADGSVTIATDSEVLGGDAFVRRAMCDWGCGRVELLAGYQFSRVNESLVISDMMTDVDPANAIVDGTTLAITDNYRTRNEYHAGTIGAAGRFEQDSWRLELLGKLGFGTMRQSLTTSGSTVIDDPNPGIPNVVLAEGLLVQARNTGTLTQDRFAISPEINAKAVYRVNDCIDVWAGYTFIYWSRVAQPGRQIDGDLFVPPQTFTMSDSEYWVHAMTLGGQLRF